MKGGSGSGVRVRPIEKLPFESFLRLNGSFPIHCRPERRTVEWQHWPNTGR
jgi:hypothetical protein